MLQYQSVPRATLDVLKFLSEQPFIKDFNLVGGTALALYWGHRISVDLDFFTDKNINLDLLDSRLGLITDTVLENKNPIGRIYVVKETKCDFLNYPYPFAYPPVIQDGIQLAHIDDVVSLKLGALANRGAKKDIYDLYYILQHYTIEKLTELYKNKYKVTDIFPLLKSLMYFGDAEGHPPPDLIKDKTLTWPQVKMFIEKTVKSAIY